MPQTAELFVIDEVFEHPVIAAIGHWDRGATSMYSFHRRAATILPRLTLSLFSASPDFAYFLAPRITRTWCVAPSSASWICMLPGSSVMSSSSTEDTPRVTPCGLSMSIS
jgi:hypothetical protein